MKTRSLALLFLVMCSAARADETPRNPAIDMEGFIASVKKAAEQRESHRVSEETFIRMSGERRTVVLDARSREKFDELHVRGAINLSFPDITVESLERAIPDRKTRILIYCNNNFVNDESAFPAKIARASLNLSTYTTLVSYGYENVYELGPLLDVKTTKIEFEGSRAK